MTQLAKEARGLWFEEFTPGCTLITDGRTITEADVVAFAGLSGDFNPIHVDAEYSAKGPFGQRVVYGLLVLSIASGLVIQTGVMQGTSAAFREINAWKFSKPVFIGDTVHVEMEVTETKAVPRLGGGLVVTAIRVINQHGDTVMKGSWTAVILSKTT